MSDLDPAPYLKYNSIMNFDWQSGSFESDENKFHTPVNRVSHYFASNALEHTTIKSRYGIDRVLECLSKEDVETAMFEGLSYYQTYLKMCNVHHKSEISILTHVCKAALVLGDKVTASTVSEYLEDVLPRPKRGIGIDYLVSYFTVSRVHARNSNKTAERSYLGAVIASYDELKQNEVCYAAESMLLLAFNFALEKDEAQYQSSVDMAKTLLEDCLKISQRLPVADEIHEEASDCFHATVTPFALEEWA